MKICLINPQITLEERYNPIIKEGGGKQAPLGICYLAAVLKKNNIPVSIIDAEAENLGSQDILKRLEKWQNFLKNNKKKFKKSEIFLH